MTPVKNCPGRNRQMTPETRSTICIGSLYWSRNSCPRDAFLAAVNLFGPTFARRASASAEVRPASIATPCWRKASSGLRAYHAVGFVGVATVMTWIPSSMWLGGEAARLPLSYD